MSKNFSISRAAGLFLPALLLLADAALATDTAARTQETKVVDGANDAHAAQAKALIDGMAEAMVSLNYRGEFVHMVGPTVEAMRILHAKNEDGEFERLTSLNGEAREVYRNDMQVTCIWPGSKSVIVGASKDRKSIPRIDADVLQSEYYRLIMKGVDRVASRETFVVDITPEDQYRFGYRFWVDKENNMLLRMLLLDEKGAIVEQFMFTSIEYPESIEQSLFVANFDKSAYTLTNTGQNGQPNSGKSEAGTTDGDIIQISGSAVQISGSAGKDLPKITPGSAKSSKSIRFSSLPGGYHKMAETYNPMPIGNFPISHVTISDGMASVSVYVEFMSADKHEKGAVGLSSMGAVNAYGASRSGAFITVVGEVPAAVVKAIGDAIVLEDG